MTWVTGGPLISETTADNQAKTNMIKELRRAQTSFQGGVFLGELRETVRAIRNPAQSLRRGLDSYLTALKQRRSRIKGKNPASRRAALRDILGGTWLEYSFGWKPLLSDIDDAAETLANHMVRSDSLARREVFAEGQTSGVWPRSSSSVSNGPLVITYYRRIHEKFTVKYYGQVDVANPHKVGYRKIGLDLSNWLPTAWELLPWSFLIDYFTNVGDIITAATTLRSSVRWMARTSVFEANHKVEGYFVQPYTNTNKDARGYVAFDPGFEERSYLTINRLPYTGSLVPSFEFQLPGGNTKWINMAALVLQGKRIRPYY